MVNSHIYEKLKEVARSNGMIFYSDLATSLSMPFDNEADRKILKNDLETFQYLILVMEDLTFSDCST